MLPARQELIRVSVRINETGGERKPVCADFAKARPVQLPRRRNGGDPAFCYRDIRRVRRMPCSVIKKRAADHEIVHWSRISFAASSAALLKRFEVSL